MIRQPSMCRKNQCIFNSRAFLIRQLCCIAGTPPTHCTHSYLSARMGPGGRSCSDECNFFIPLVVSVSAPSLQLFFGLFSARLFPKRVYTLHIVIFN